jgi:hypothetical protein
MKRYLFCILLLLSSTLVVRAQDEVDEEEKKGGFKKENLFTGGSLSLSFYNGGFLAGVNPVLGYSLTNWLDAGLVVNYTYSSYRNYFTSDDKLRQSIYGGGAFTRVFPVRFIFLQGQAERNIIRQKYVPGGGAENTIDTKSANSILVGGGYTTGRQPGNNSFFYLAVLFDVTKNEYSPYIDGYGRIRPVIRAGLNILLFQTKYER